MAILKISVHDESITTRLYLCASISVNKLREHFHDIEKSSFHIATWEIKDGYMSKIYLSAATPRKTPATVKTAMNEGPARIW
jgi:hypothetical protein